jgi:sortase A
VNANRTLACAAAAAGITGLVAAGWIQMQGSAQDPNEAAWQRARDSADAARPWSWPDTTPVARLTISGESLFVLEGLSERNRQAGPTHDMTSVMPGDAGNSVIEGHRETHLKILRRVRMGDRVRVERADGRVAEFIVTQRRVVDTRRQRVAPQAQSTRLTLVTGYPFDKFEPGGPLRFVVTADFIAGAGNSPPQRVARAAVTS